MRVLILRLIFPLCLVLLAGCAGMTKEGDSGNDTGAPSESKGEASPLPFERPSAPISELNSDVVFSALMGEVALQRGELDLAYRNLMQAALLAGDPNAAERAARTAMLMNRHDLAQRAVDRWVELAPNDLGGRQLEVLLLSNGQEPERALPHMEAMVAISEARGEDGFIASMAALSKSENHQAAIVLMSRLAAAHPDDPRSGYALVLMAVIWKDYATAEQEIGRVIAQRPDWSKAYVLLSRIHMAKGDKEGARRVLEEALRRNPSDPVLNSALAKVLVESDEYEEGYRRFLKVAKLSPQDNDALFSLGVLALQLKRPEKARVHFQLLWKRGKRLDETAYYMGLIEEQEGHPEKAIQWYRKVSKGDRYFGSRIRIAELLAAGGRLQEARDGLQGLRIHMQNRSVQLFLIEAEIVRDYGSAADVMPLYNKALKAHPENEELLYARGLYAAEIGRLDILESDLRKIIERNPKNADALNALGYTLADQSDRYAEAQSLIQRALAIKPDSPAILDSMGWLQFRLGNYDQASAYLNRAFSLLPDSEIAAHLGEVLWVKGEKQQARQVWQKMLDIDPDSRHVKETMKRLMK